MLEIKAIYHGKVQGVGFRQATLKLAEAIDLKGYIKNKSDGTVELLAQGDRRQIDQLLDGLKQAFGGRWIEKVETTEHKPKHFYKDFSISL